MPLGKTSLSQSRVADRQDKSVACLAYGSAILVDKDTPEAVASLFTISGRAGRDRSCREAAIKHFGCLQALRWQMKPCMVL